MSVFNLTISIGVAIANGGTLGDILKGAAIGAIADYIGGFIPGDFSIGKYFDFSFGDAVAAGIASKASGQKFIDGVKGYAAGKAAKAGFDALGEGFANVNNQATEKKAETTNSGKADPTKPNDYVQFEPCLAGEACTEQYDSSLSADKTETKTLYDMLSEKPDEISDSQWKKLKEEFKDRQWKKFTKKVCSGASSCEGLRNNVMNSLPLHLKLPGKTLADKIYANCRVVMHGHVQKMCATPK